jgi:hypothetical protein
MRPSGIATSHPAGVLLQEWAQMGCPTKTGQTWSKDKMWEAVKQCPHRLALFPDALKHFAEEAIEKVAAGQAKIVKRDSIRDNLPAQLKISPIMAITHKSQGFHSILNLSFSLHFTNDRVLLSVNVMTIKMAPKGALNQLGHALSRIIHTFAETKDDDTTMIFMAKWDIKDDFWHMCYKDGAEGNFAYVLPQAEGQPSRLVVPTSLQMGWVESPPYFCAASEMARDVAMEYGNTEVVGLLPSHMFTHYTRGDTTAAHLPQTSLTVTTLSSKRSLRRGKGNIALSRPC